MKNKIKDVPVELNSKKGALWKQTAFATKQKIEIGKIQAELDKVILDYCEKKVEEDKEKVKKDLENKS